MRSNAVQHSLNIIYPTLNNIWPQPVDPNTLRPPYLSAVLLHVIVGVVIGIDYDELVLVKLKSSAHIEIAFPVVGGRLCAELLLVGTFHLSTFQKLPTGNT